MSVVHVPLPRGLVARVDARDLSLLHDRKWRLQRYVSPSGREYVYLSEAKTRDLFHRVLLGAQAGQFVDHIDGDGLNNSRANLRICTHSENMRNRRPNLGKLLPKGVQIKNGMFAAQIRAGNVRRFEGGFLTIEAAQQRYTEWARELHGDFARAPEPTKAAA